MEKCGESDVQFRRWTGFERAEIVFPDRVDMVEILSDTDPFLEFRNDVSEQTGRSQEVDTESWILREDDAENSSRMRSREMTLRLAAYF